MTTNMSIRRCNTFRPYGGRRAMTLIEIMAAILVLSVGLVGILAAIPFGGFRMAQMNEADNSSGLGRNAVRLMKSNDWANPKNWWLKNLANSNLGSANPNAILDDPAYYGHLNLTFPFLVDPLGTAAGNYFPEFSTATPNAGYSVFFTRVCPLPQNTSGNPNTAMLDARYERAFYLQDDLVSGYEESEDESEYRPRIETEGDVVLNAGDVPSFSGRYSWLATVSLQNTGDVFYNCALSSVGSADYDVAVFKDRIIGDERVYTAVVEGSGYQGGVINIDLTTGLFMSGDSASDTIDRSRLLEQLESTRYLMLWGQDDVPVDGNHRAFAKWYKIANYSVVKKDDVGNPLTLRVSLIGPDTPTGWATGAKNVSVLFFPGVVGVYSGTTTF